MNLAHTLQAVARHAGDRPALTWDAGQLTYAELEGQVRQIAGVSLYSSDYPLEWMPEPWEGVARAASWLLDLAATHAVSLVHLNGYVHADLPWGRPVIVAAHSCVWTWWRAVHGARAE